jgi:hypothetical protein
LSAIVATPFAIGAAVFMTEISPKKGAKFLQPVITAIIGKAPTMGLPSAPISLGFQFVPNKKSNTLILSLKNVENY